MMASEPDNERRSDEIVDNADDAVVAAFGEEWKKFDQSRLSSEESSRLFQQYFAVFPWHRISKESEGFDLGCGSGRWAANVAPHVGRLYCIDPSNAALAVARRNLARFDNVDFLNESVSSISLRDASMDFAYSLGVLHHVPDTERAIRSVATKLKDGAPFLVYLYYAFDNRPVWYRLLHKFSEVVRYAISHSPFVIRYPASQVMATLVYWPLARTALLLERAGVNVSSLPLSAYRKLSFYTMRTDALDRFGTRLEQRFTQKDIKRMLIAAGFDDIAFSETEPYWCAVGIKQ